MYFAAIPPNLSEDGECGGTRKITEERGVEGKIGPLHLGKVNYSRGFEIVLARVNNPEAQVISNIWGVRPIRLGSGVTAGRKANPELQ